MADKAPSVNYVKASTLVGYARNSKTHSAVEIGKLVASITEWGWTNPILVDEQGVIAGHGRLEAALSLYENGKDIKLPSGELIPSGMVPVINCQGWDEGKRRAYIIADNKLPEVTGSWDFEMLAVELDSLNDLGFDVSALGFSQDEINDLIGTPNEPPINDGGGDVADNYSEQYGVIVVCENAGEQERTYNKLMELGYNCKVVCT